MSTILDTYVSEIGRNLPRDRRQDIEIEIRSSLLDTLEDRSKESGRSVDDELTYEVLKEAGSPESVAAAYLPERYLIGPRLYPIFLLVVRIALPVLTVLGCIGMGALLAGSSYTPAGLTETLAKLISELVNILMQTFGSIVVVFAILQRLLPNLAVKARSWDPRSLAKIKPSDHVSLATAVSGMVFCLAAIVIFNFYPGMLRVWNYTDGSWRSIAIFTPAFFSYVPAWTAVWALTVVVNILLVRQGRWQSWMRWISAATSAATIVIAILMLAGPSLVLVDTAQMAAMMPAGTEILHDWFAESIQWSVRLVLVLVIVGAGTDLVRTIFHIYEKELPSVLAPRK
jgi:hypothetical protein